MYVFQYKKTQNGTWVLGNSKPCSDCLVLIKKAGIKNVYYSVAYTDENGTHYGIMKERAKDMKTDHISMGRRGEKMRNDKKIR